jgi:hypothetical protein
MTLDRRAPKRFPQKASLVTALFLLFALPLAAEQPDVTAISSRDAVLVQLFCGGTTLTSAERSELDNAIRQSFATNPAGARAAADESAKLLALIPQHPGPQLATAIKFGRTAIAFSYLQALSPQPVTQVVARIVAAHDPVVAEDPAKQYLVTMQTVRALAQSNHQGAALFSVPDPGPSPELLATAIRKYWSSTDDGMRQALSNAVRDLPFTEPYLAQTPPAARTKFIDTYHRTILEPPDPEARQLRLAEVMAFVGQAGFKKGGAGSGGSTVDRAWENQALYDRAGRALMPGCGVAAGSVMSPGKSQFCNPSPLP